MFKILSTYILLIISNCLMSQQLDTVSLSIEIENYNDARKVGVFFDCIEIEAESFVSIKESNIFKKNSEIIDMYSEFVEGSSLRDFDLHIVVERNYQPFRVSFTITKNGVFIKDSFLPFKEIMPDKFKIVGYSDIVRRTPCKP